MAIGLITIFSLISTYGLISIISRRSAQSGFLIVTIGLIPQIITCMVSHTNLLLLMPFFGVSSIVAWLISARSARSTAHIVSEPVKSEPVKKESRKSAQQITEIVDLKKAKTADLLTELTARGQVR